MYTKYGIHVKFNFNNNVITKTDMIMKIILKLEMELELELELDMEMAMKMKLKMKIGKKRGYYQKVETKIKEKRIIKM